MADEWRGESPIPSAALARSRTKVRKLRSSEISGDEFNWELAAEAITVKLRWFGLCVGFVLVNLLEQPGSTPLTQNQLVLNAILTLGMIYALVDTYWSLRGKVFPAGRGCATSTSSSLR